MSPWFIILPVILSPWAVAEPVVGGRPGYLSSVKDERYARETEMVLFSPPPVSHGIWAGRPLVNDKLTREFQTQYELKFGHTEAERNLSTSNRFAFYEYPGGQMETIEAHTARQRQFGEYMFRRLVEYHLDEYAKSNPEVRPIYELKDRISNVNVQVKKGYRLRLRYSYSGNYVDARLENPYDVATKLTFQMKEGMGPSEVQRTILSLRYGFSKRLSGEAVNEFDKALGSSLIGGYQWTKSFATTLTGSNHVLVDRDNPENSPRQNLILVGMSWTE